MSICRYHDWIMEAKMKLEEEKDGDEEREQIVRVITMLSVETAV